MFKRETYEKNGNTYFSYFVQGDVRGLFAGKVMMQGDIIGSQIRAPRPSMNMGFGSLFD